MKFRLKSAGLIALFGVTACAPLGIPAVKDAPNGQLASPAALAPFGDDAAVENAADWERRRAPVLREAFETHLYGVIPPLGPARRTETRLVETGAFDGRARIEEWSVGYLLDAEGRPRRDFKLAVVIPETGAEARPVVILQTFCGNRRALAPADVASPFGPDNDGPCGESFLTPLFLWVFGEHIMSPPVERILERGYALAFMYPGEIVPDADAPARAAMAALSEAAGGVEISAVGAWASGFSLAIDALEADGRFDAGRMAVWGHSRHGKAALVAGAYDPRVDLVIAHQSGTGGATLSRSDAGESVKAITRTYPYWFNEAFAAYAGREADIPVDQHQLLALIAPRPIFLGNARRDVWSDPQGAYAAARGADPVYELLGAEGLNQPDLVSVNFEADIAFYMRGGRHGVTAEDWDAFLAFLDAQFRAP